MHPSKAAVCIYSISFSEEHMLVNIIKCHVTIFISIIVNIFVLSLQIAFA